jgi:long-chain fatty acid transport protein
MKKRLSMVVALASVFAVSSAYASGYRIPEQSADSVAKAGAHIASAKGADASYFNPANMSFAEDGWLTEVDLTYIHLTEIDYTDGRTPLMNGTSDTENFLLPTVFMVSPDFANFRFGFSVTAPFGLAKRWEDPFPATYARKFSLQVFDINPTVSYAVTDYLSVSGGVRLLMAKAIARNGGRTAQGIAFDRDLEGDWEADYGYNLAVAVQPMEA